MTAPRLGKLAKRFRRGLIAIAVVIGSITVGLSARADHGPSNLELPALFAADDLAPAQNRTDNLGQTLLVQLIEPPVEWPDVIGPSETVNPDVLRAPGDVPSLTAPRPDWIEPEPLFTYPFDAPLGYSGPSGILPRDFQQSPHFVPIEDRWRVGFPEWDRYGTGQVPVVDTPYELGERWNPYNQSVLKGDYPIIGQHTFLTVTATSQTLLEFRQVPTPTTPFESTTDPFEESFFGDPDQFFYKNNTILSFDLLHGDAAFKPADWRIKVTSIFNDNYLDVEELAIVNPDVRRGTTRLRDDFALEEWFVESKLADLSADYDFMSVRAGSQLFNSDFRGFIFSDTNRAVRLFGTREANRDQFNVIWFDQTEKETNSELNTFEDRHQNTVIANYYRQDFIWPGYTAQLSYHYNNDQESFRFDENNFLVRPDPVGVFQPHEVDAHYIGWAGDGHINRINISHAYYYVQGEDELNPLAGRRTRIDAHMAALELSYDRDWIRFRSSFFYASGDDNIEDGSAEGFDAIFDNPAFAGGEFSFWQRQAVRLLGVNLTNRGSLLADLSSSKLQGQTNFVNPGLYLFNLGMDFEVTPKARLVSNVNFLWFDETDVLERFVFQDDIDEQIGTDLSLGVEYRPLLSNNIILIAGVAGLIPGTGFEDLYNDFDGDTDGLFAGFTELVLTF